MSQNKNSTDLETIVICLKNAVEQEFFKSQDQEIIQILKSLLGNIETHFEWKLNSAVHDLLMQIYPDLQDEDLKKTAGEAITVFDTSPLFNDTMTENEKIYLLEMMHTISQAERKVLIQDTMPLFNDAMSAYAKGELLMTMHKIPQEERKALIQDTMPLFNDDTDFNTKINYLSTIRCIAKEQRSALIQEILPLLPVFRQIDSQNDIMIFYLLPHELRTEERLSSVRSFFEDPAYKTAITTSLEHELSNERTSVSLLMKLAEFATGLQDKLGLHDEHPVIQQAIEIRSCNEVVGEKNPFSLYKKLQTLAKESATFQSPSFEISGGKTSFRLDQLQASGKAFKVTREELPKDATQEAWLSLVNTLKQKVESNPAAKKLLEEEYDTSWEELWNGSLSDPYLSGILTLSSEKVPVVEAQFRAIVHHLFAKDKTVKPGEIFSEQEDVLIKQGMSIQHCSGGKKEGIAFTYKLLDPVYQYHAKGLEGKSPEEIQAKEFLSSVLQQALSDQFSGTNALMQELVGIQNINQGSHQAIYLKNLIGPLVGLHHEVAFDRYSGVLYDSLIAKSREEVLQVFFRHFTPQVLLNELMRVVNNDFRTNYNIVRHIVSDLEGWDYDEETFNPIKLNERGALQLLQTAGFLT